MMSARDAALLKMCPPPPRLLPTNQQSSSMQEIQRGQSNAQLKVANPRCSAAQLQVVIFIGALL
jgi:hypothetical protein